MPAVSQLAVTMSTWRAMARTSLLIRNIVFCFAMKMMNADGSIRDAYYISLRDGVGRGVGLRWVCFIIPRSLGNRMTGKCSGQFWFLGS